MSSLKYKFITLNDRDYPKLLKEIFDPPKKLYFLGDLKISALPCLAVVGSRKINSYGQRVTEFFTADIARNNICIVSGLALGTDAIAHQAALNVNGKTIAVLGSGIDDITPKTNQGLAKKIINSGGLILSEFPPETPAYPGNFPQRNRIISGLSLGTLITGAGERSGTLITAKYALEQGRDVFAVPGEIFNPLSYGTNDLIAQGAKPVHHPSEILEIFNITPILQQKIIINLNDTEKIIFDCIDSTPMHVDKISQLARLDISTINSTLAVLEMKGLVKNLGQQIYSRP